MEMYSFMECHDNPFIVAPGLHAPRVASLRQPWATEIEMGGAAPDIPSCNFFAKLDAASPYLWVAICAILGNSLLSIQWWHPYCDHPVDGTSYFAWGFPLPDSETSGASSLAYYLLPHVYLLNLALLAAVSFPFVRAFHRWAAQQPRWLLRTASVLGLVLALLIAVPGSVLISDLAQGSWTFGLHGDSYWSYRPAAFALSDGHRACSY